MKLRLLFCLTLFSTLFWMKFTTDFIGWSVVECAAAGFFLSLLIRKQALLLPQRAFLLPLLLLAFYSATSSFWSPNFHATLTGTYKLLFILFLLILFCNNRAQWEKAMEMSILIAGTAVSLWNLSGIPMSNFNHLIAGFLSAGAVLSCARIFSSFHPTERFTAAMLLALHLWTLFVLASLAAILAAATGILFLFLFYKKKLWIFFVSLICLLSLTFFEPKETGTVPIKNPLNVVWSRKKTDPFAFERAQIWKDSFSYFKNYALFGSGMGTYREFYPEFKKIEGLRNAPYAHNEFIHILCELGLAGMSILLWFVWNLYTLLKNTAIFNHPAKTKWLAVAILCLTHSLFDFNLRYPPTLTVFVFSISILLPLSEPLTPSPKTRWGTILLLMGYILLFSLPGIAEFIFKRYQHLPEKRAVATEWSRRLDPFFSFYHFQTGKMRDLTVAIYLEPRNVWYRRTAAQFYLQQWEKTKEKQYLKEALEEYMLLLQFAPNVPEFQREAEEFKEKIKTKI